MATEPFSPKPSAALPVCASIAQRRLPVRKRMRGASLPSPGQYPRPRAETCGPPPRPPRPPPPAGPPAARPPRVHHRAHPRERPGRRQPRQALLERLVPASVGGQRRRRGSGRGERPDLHAVLAIDRRHAAAVRDVHDPVHGKRDGRAAALHRERPGQLQIGDVRRVDLSERRVARRREVAIDRLPVAWRHDARLLRLRPRGARRACRESHHNPRQ